MAVATKKKSRQLTPEEILSSVDPETLSYHKLLRRDPVLFCKLVCGFEPHKKQRELLRSPLENLKTLIAWGRRQGKSWIVAVYISWKLYSVKGYNAFIFAPSNDQSRILFDYIVGIYESSYYLRTHSKIRIKGNTLFVGGKDWGSKVEHVKTGLVGDNARGRGIKNGKGIIVFDEINSFIYPAEVTATISPFAATGGGMVLLSSPGEVGSWFHSVYEDWTEQQKQGSPLHKVIDCTIYDTNHIDANWIAEEKRTLIAQGREWFFKREYLGEWTVTEGAFFDRDDVTDCHVQGELTGGRGDTWIYSLDPGLDRSPSVLLVARYNSLLDRLEIVTCLSLVRFSNDHVGDDDGHERVESYQELIDRILDLRRSKPCHVFYIDPGCEKNIGEQLKNTYRVNVIDCRVGGYSAKLTALKDLQRSIGDQKIVWNDHRITNQLVNFAPPTNRQTGRFEFPDKSYDIIAALTQLNRYIGDRVLSPFAVELVHRRESVLW